MGVERGQRGLGSTAAARFLGTLDAVARRDLAAMRRRRGSRETRDAPGDASGASVDVSRSSRSVTLAWRDDLVILARLRPSAPQTVRVVAPRARSRRGEERRGAPPRPARRVCPLDRRRRARRDASRRATRRDGRTCAPARRGCAAARLASVWKALDPRRARNARILGTADGTSSEKGCRCG